MPQQSSRVSPPHQSVHSTQATHSGPIPSLPCLAPAGVSSFTQYLPGTAQVAQAGVLGTQGSRIATPVPGHCPTAPV
jgi:hypothetical protein